MALDGTVTVSEVEDAALGVGPLIVPEAPVKTTVLVEAIALNPVPVNVRGEPTAARPGEIDESTRGCDGPGGV